MADWLVDRMRKALTDRGLTTMAERQTAIEIIAGRSIDSLRSLTRAEALRVVEQLGSASAASTRSTSAWDQRDEDTWIDRL